MTFDVQTLDNKTLITIGIILIFILSLLYIFGFLTALDSLDEKKLNLDKINLKNWKSNSLKALSLSTIPTIFFTPIILIVFNVSPFDILIKESQNKGIPIIDIIDKDINKESISIIDIIDKNIDKEAIVITKDKTLTTCNINIEPNNGKRNNFNVTVDKKCLTGAPIPKETGIPNGWTQNDKTGTYIDPLGKENSSCKIVGETFSNGYFICDGKLVTK